MHITMKISYLCLRACARMHVLVHMCECMWDCEGRRAILSVSEYVSVTVSECLSASVVQCMCVRIECECIRVECECVRV